ncbi:uncharacterized protein LOC107806413 [Nicotiana tabacum]|uniref:Uncharacterized protein LOC107806413 n=2 Tax=Nicotiana tabacum TaxID=4097 RepID=A0AC58S3P1_TOBAC
MKKKSDVSIIFPKFKALVEKFFATPIVTLYSDNGGEYIYLRDFFTSHGISHFLTPPYTPEYNGTAERRHCHIVETADNTVLTWAPHYIIPLPTGSTNSMAPPSTGASSSLTPSSCKALGTSNSYQGTTSLSSSSILSPASPDSSSVQEHRSLAVTTVEPMSLSDPISTHSMPSSLPIFSPLASTGTPEHMEISVSPALSTAPPPPPSQNSHHMVTRS